MQHTGLNPYQNESPFYITIYTSYKLLETSGLSGPPCTCILTWSICTVLKSRC